MIAAPRIVAAGLLAALLLAACTDDPQPRFAEPSETPSATESTSPAAAEKEPWEEKSKAGAVAFAKHWVDIFNEAVLSGETSELKRISDEACLTCKGFEGRIEDVYSAGGKYFDHHWQVTKSTVAPGGSDGQLQLVLRIRRAPERFRESEQAKVERNPASSATFTVDIIWRRNNWVAKRLVLL